VPSQARGFFDISNSWDIRKGLLCAPRLLSKRQSFFGIPVRYLARILLDYEHKLRHAQGVALK
jgi:hypothetical protein